MSNPNTTVIQELEADISTIENDLSLFEEKNFNQRTEAIDLIEFQILSQIEILLQKTALRSQLLLLKHRAEKVKFQLEEIDGSLFQKLRDNIKTGELRTEKLRNLINGCFGFNANYGEQEEIGYDNLDVFINGLLPHQAMPEQTKDLEPDMVFYQKTPARIVFELANQLKKEDVFFDLGSGLGQVAILINLLAGSKTIGVEFEPAFCAYAQNCATELNLPNVTFINADARNANYSDGTVFFMYTPFKGEIMEEVLEVLRSTSLPRKIKIFTYGPCTAQIASQNWLEFAGPQDDNIYKLGVFTSL